MDTRIRIIAEAITKDAENNLKRLADLEKDLQEETTKAGDATKKQETNLNSLNDTANKSNSTFANLGKTMLALFAVDKLIDYSKQLITLMGDTDKYRIALMNVSTSQKEYEKSIEFISKLSKDYGQNVNILTQSYTSFIASSKSSNLTLDERQKIYQSIIKAGSALKLSNDGIEGSLRAVSQMFSKGNISAEELRGQLSERLPGAFGELAKAMKITEPQLNKMLEQGQVLAKDALPLLAQRFEELYGDKAQSNLKTIGGAWNVFVNNFIEGLQDFNKSSLFIETISKWILSAANGFKNFIDVIKEAFTIGTQYNNVLNTMFDYYEIVWGAIKNVGGALWDLIETLSDVIFNITGAGNASKFLQYWVDVVSYAIKGLGTGLIGAITLTQALADTFNALINTGKKVLNFFGGDFKIDTNATFGAVADNFKKNVGRIGNLWTDSQKGILGTNKTTQKAIIDESENTTNNILKQNEGLTEKQKKELLKRSSEQQKLEKENNEFIKTEKEKTQIAISEIEHRGEEERAFEREKWLDRIFRIYTSNYTKIKKVTDDTTKESKTAGEKYSQQLKDRFDNDSETIKKRLEKNSRFFHSILEEDGEFLKGWYDNLTKQQQNIVDQGISMVGNFLENQIGKIDEAIDKTTDLYEKARLETQKNWLEVGTDAVKTFDQMLSGNVVGSIVGTIKTLAGALDNWLMSNAREERARLEQELVLLKKAGEEFIKSTEGLFSASDIESIKSVYGGLIDTFNTTLRLDLGEFDNPERRLQQEILIGEQIVDNYNKAVTNENGLHSQKIDNINSEYNAAVKAINDKYNLEKGLADTAFGAASLAIQEQTNQQLIALLTNQDTRLSLDADYNAKRAYIFNQYASQIKDITPEMSQVEIDGINAAIQARDNALSEVEKWLQEELKFVLSNEEQKRKEYSATEKIIKDGEDAIEALRIEYNANELERLTTKNLAIEAAEKTKNTNIETETQRHNDSIVAITKAKDEQLAESFKILQDIIKNGYDEVMAKALDAYNAGKITADQYNEIAMRLFKINSLINGIDWAIPGKSIFPDLNLDNLNLPRFNTGTEKVGGKKGVDKNLALLSYDEGVIRGDLNEKRLNAGLNMHKTIEYAINYKSILDGGLHPLKIKESALNKLEEHAAMQYLLNFNMKPVIEKLDSVERALKSIPIQNFNLDEKGLSKYVETKNNVTKFKNKRLK